MTFQKLFKEYIVTRKNGQCQVLIPLIELDKLCKKIEVLAKKKFQFKPTKEQKSMFNHAKIKFKGGRGL